MKKEEFTFKSSDGMTSIHAIRWIPEGEIKGIVQLTHGMSEYIDRYDPFARFLCEKGLLVTGHDHLGHGKSLNENGEPGYFAEKNGNSCVLGDMEKLRLLTVKLYPEKPYFILGHSMGSFLVRQFICFRGTELSGAVVMGTGNQSGAVTSFGKVVCDFIALFKGWYHRSDFVNGLSFGSYNKGYGKIGGFEWLTKNEECVKAYEADPLCGFPFTLNGYYNMFHSIYLLSKEKYIERMPKTLPVLFVSGEDDPVGNRGKGPREVYESFRKLGMKNVKMILYPTDRHEILNELDKDTVYNDIADWIFENMPK